MINPHEINFRPIVKKIRAYNRTTVADIEFAQIFISSSGQPLIRYKIGKFEKFINADGVKEIVEFTAGNKTIDCYYIDLQRLKMTDGTQMESANASNMTLYYDKDGVQQDCWQKQAIKNFKYYQGR